MRPWSWPAALRLPRRTIRLRLTLLASAKIDVVIESDVNILHIAALAVIVEAAGGRFTDLEGRAPGLETTSVLATNGKLHDAVLQAL